VAREILATEGRLVVRENGALMLSVSMDSVEMPQAQFGFKEIRDASPRRRISGRQLPVALLHRHKGADWKFGEEFASSFLRQSNAAV
jgi:hypothetical protein